MFSRLVCAVACLLLPALLLAHPGHEHPEATILDEKNWDDHVPQGKEVDAIYGDAVLTNKYITAVIANPVSTRNANMTVRNVGGCLIDLSVNDRSSDQLSCFYPGMRKYVYRGFEVASKSTVKITDEGKALDQASAHVITRATGDEKTPAVELTYRLDEDAQFLLVITKFTNSGKQDLTIPLTDDLRADGGKEEMPKTPNGEHNLYWFHDKFWGQAYGFEVVGGKIDSQSSSRSSTLKYSLDGKNTKTLKPGESFELTRKIYPGKDLLEVKAIHDELHDRATSSVAVQIVDHADKAIPNATVEFKQGDTRRGSGKTDLDGKLNAALPNGEYTINVECMGVELGNKDAIRFNVKKNADDLEFSLDELKLSFDDWKPGIVAADITDVEGKPIACKVEFTPKGDAPKPYFGPETAEFAVMNLRYAPHGEFEQALPEGEYDVIISHGPEYDAIFTSVKISAGETTPLTGKLLRTVDTTGWVSADFHSHSSPSGDNTGSQLGRVLNLVCEHIEFAPCTEHNRIETYEPEIELLKIGDAIRTVSGMELTGSPLPLNHQNVFPLIRKPRTQDGGGPVTDSDPSTQIERLFLWDDRSEKLIQQNHPDIGWLFYDRNGDGVPDEGYERSHGLIDVMEIHPVHLALDLKPVSQYRGRDYANRIFGWLQLLNQGYRIPGVSHTDAHYNYHGSGGLRVWIQSSTDEPAKIDITEMIHASEEGRVIMSNGPFLEFEVNEVGQKQQAVAGQDLSAKSKKVMVHIKVQSPNWIDIDRVFLLVNGRPHKVHNYRKETDPAKFKEGVVKFEQTFEVELQEDAHLIAVTGGEKSKLGPVMGPFWGGHEPAALANPVFVDVDGDGFAPNKDTLDHPLPVKFGVERKE